MSDDSSFVRHVPCETCGSSNNGSLYTDGHTYCHVCGTYTHADGGPVAQGRTRVKDLLSGVEPIALASRKLDIETTTKFGYGVTTSNGQTVQVAPYRDKSGQIVAQHIRTKDKQFSWRGANVTTELFGKHLWGEGGKKIVITEGEIDCMSVSQAQGNKWPVVSVPNGAQSAKKAIAANVEWLETFEQVIFMFDNDEPGRKGAVECAQVISPGKAFIATLDLKDANEMLKAGRGPEIINAIWKAAPYRPDGIVCGSDLWDRINDTSTFESVPYPFEGLNALTDGIRPRELVTLTAGTGIGKSEVARQIAAHFHDKHGETIGYIALEESAQRTALGFMGLALGKRLNLRMDHVPEADREEAFKATIGSGRYFLYDHWGSLDKDNLILRIRFLAKACHCQTIILDHISIVVSGLEIDDERKAIDVLMTTLRSLVEELGIKMILICHLRRNNESKHEEGGRVSLSDLRGSQAIAQLSNFVIALERDQQDDGPARDYTTVRVLKNRHTGATGVACVLKYDHETGRLSESEMPAEDSAEAFSETAETTKDY